MFQLGRCVPLVFISVCLHIIGVLLSVHHVQPVIHRHMPSTCSVCSAGPCTAPHRVSSASFSGQDDTPPCRQCCASTHTAAHLNSYCWMILLILLDLVQLVDVHVGHQVDTLHPLVPQHLVVGIQTSLLLRSPCKIAKPYDNPFWEN